MTLGRLVRSDVIQKIKKKANTNKKIHKKLKCTGKPTHTERKDRNLGIPMRAEAAQVNEQHTEGKL